MTRAALLPGKIHRMHVCARMHACRVDVAYFELLESRLYAPLSAAGKEWVHRRSAERVACARGPAFKNGRDMAVAPS